MPMCCNRRITDKNNTRKVAFSKGIIKKRIYFCEAIMISNPSISFQDETDILTLTDDQCHLVVWNDEVNTFEWVIETLVDICGHSQEQAEQCSMIIHTKGKYAVKEGSYDILKPLCDAITERGIGATVEVVAA